MPSRILGLFLCLATFPTFAQNKAYEKVYINRQQATAMVEDQQGYLWTNAKISPYLYRYDGYNQITFGKGEQYDLELDTAYVHSYLHLLSDGQLLSISFPTQTILILNPITFEKQIYQLTLEGRIRGAAVNNEGEVALVTNIGDDSYIYLWKNEILAEKKIHTPIKYLKAILQNDAHSLWIRFSNGYAYRYFWKEKELKMVAKEDFQGIQTIREEYGGPLNADPSFPYTFHYFYLSPNEDLYAVSLYLIPSVYRFNHSEQVFEPVPALKDKGYCWNPHSDEEGNLLVQCDATLALIPSRGNAVLLNVEGQEIPFPFKDLAANEKFLGLIEGKDFTKMAWLANDDGLVKLENKKNKIHIYEHNEPFRKAIPINADTILVGSAKIGLMTLHPKQQEVKRHNTYWHKINSGKAKDQRPGLTGLAIDKTGYYWANNKTHLIRTKLDTNHVSLFPTPDTLGAAWKLLSTGEICLFTKSKGLYLFDLKTEQYTPITLPPNIQFKEVNLILEPHPDLIYLATDSGLLLWNRSTHTFEIFTKNDGLSDDYIYTIYDSPSDSLWLGTKKGITIFNKKTKTTTIINEKDGLVHPAVVDIIPHRNQYWIFTKNGICTYAPNTKTFRSYGANHGFPSLTFPPNSALKISNTFLFIGTERGFLTFNPDELSDDPIPSLHLSVIEYYEEVSQSVKSHVENLEKQSTVYLPAQNKYLSIQLNLSEKTNQNYHRYAYRINSLSQDWVQLGNQNQITFSNLPAGQHLLEIKGATQNSDWSAIQNIHLTVGVFFYETWWFLGLCFLLVAALVLAWIYRLRSEKIYLEKVVQERTAQIHADKTIIEQQAAALQSLDELKTRFYTNITHEFRTPLTIILGMANQIQNQPKVWLQQGLSMIQRNGHSLLNLINQLLDLQKLEAGRMPLNNIQSDVLVYLKYLLESFHSLAESQGIQVSFQSNSSQIIMDYDPEKLMTIISNLLSNAVKFSKYGDTVTLTANIANSSHPSPTLEIAIKDTGRGIPAEQLPYIFDRFYQVDGSTSRQGEGTGIGLALCKELVQVMGGQIKVQSRLGVGTTLYLHFPITRKAKKSSPLPQALPIVAEQPPTVQSEPQKRPSKEQSLILIIEDNPDVRFYLKTCLQDKYALLFAENGQLGINQAIEHIPDIIISDVMMPKKDGFEVCETLKQNELTSHIPIILLTAKATVADRISGLQYGADAYLAKPFHPEELEVRLAQLIENRRRLQKKFGIATIIKKSTEDRESVYLQKTQQVILDNLETTPFGPNELAHALGTSRSQLHRKLKALTDLSTSNYINSIRLTEAKKLLLTTDLSISEVAYQVGFSTLKYFTTVFTKTYQVSPKSYREEMLK